MSVLHLHVKIALCKLCIDFRMIYFLADIVGTSKCLWCHQISMQILFSQLYVCNLVYFGYYYTGVILLFAIPWATAIPVNRKEAWHVSFLFLLITKQWNWFEISLTIFHQGRIIYSCAFPATFGGEWFIAWLALQHRQQIRQTKPH